MVRPGWPRQTITARSSRQPRRFPHLINADKVFGTHSDPSSDVRLTNCTFGFERNLVPVLSNPPPPPHIERVVSMRLSCSDLESGMDKFDYDAPAELYPGRNRKSIKKVGYRRFETAADAIRFAVEELPALLLLGAFIEIDERRFGCKDIQALYESERYPLKKLMN